MAEKVSVRKDSNSSNQDKEKVIQREVLYKWSSPMRHFKRMDIKRYWVIAAIVLAFFVVLTIVGQFWLMIAITAVMFLIYVIGTVPPVVLDHCVTTLGVESTGQNTQWKHLKSYWFSKKDNQMHINIDTNIAFPGRLIMLVSEKEADDLHKILNDRLKYSDMREQKYMSKVVDGVWMDKLEEDDISKG